MQIHSRLPDIGTTIFTLMSRMAAEHNAINLSQGFPDFEIDPALSTLVCEAMSQGFNQYAPMAGVPQLKEAIAQIVQRTYQLKIDPETQITVTAGATQALFSVVSAFISSGDEVIVFDPAYDSYNPAIRLSGGVPIHISLRYPEFKVDWDQVRSRITNRTKMIVINNPHNPLGTTLSSDDLNQLEAIALNHGLIVLSDEVYERLVYDGHSHESVLRYPGLASQSLACYSFGKTFHATGWKVGYVIGPADLMAEVRKTHQYIVFSVNTAVQVALAKYLENPEHYEGIARFYERKRDFFLKNLEGSSWVPLQSKGSYFQLLSYKNIDSLPDFEMAVSLTRNYRIASIPVSVFYQDRTDDKILRFCFAKKEETLLRACEILRRM